MIRINGIYNERWPLRVGNDVLWFGECTVYISKNNELDISKDIVGKMVVYTVYILIFSKSANDHTRDVSEALEIMGSHGFRLNINKCVFGVKEVWFLGFEIYDSRIRISEKQKRKSVELVKPKNVRRSGSG